MLMNVAIRLQSWMRMVLAKRVNAERAAAAQDLTAAARQERARRKLEGNISKYHQKRTYIFKEIVATEESYVTDLDTAVEVRRARTRRGHRGGRRGK